MVWFKVINPLMDYSVCHEFIFVDHHEYTWAKLIINFRPQTIAQANKKIFCHKEKVVESFWDYIGGAESENALSFSEMALVFTFIIL